jgi:hypothetical protein
MSSNNSLRFASVLKSSAASRKGLGEDVESVVEPVEQSEAPTPIESHQPVLAPAQLSTRRSSSQRADLAESNSGKKRTGKASWEPFSTRANPALIKAVNRQLFEDDRHFTDLLDELLTKWLQERTGSA